MRLCDPSVLLRLLQNIVLSGGSTMFQHFGQRLKRDIKQIVDQRLEMAAAASGSAMRSSGVEVDVISHKRQRYGLLRRLGISRPLTTHLSATRFGSVAPSSPHWYVVRARFEIAVLRFPSAGLLHFMSHEGAVRRDWAQHLPPLPNLRQFHIKHGTPVCISCEKRGGSSPITGVRRLAVNVRSRPDAHRAGREEQARLLRR
jgi:hypothetical protein